MVTFRNNTNNRRNNFRRNDRGFKSNGDRPKYRTNFSNNENFQRKVPGRNNHNASKLIEKYNDLARDAITSGDKILSENYFQHADHFTRVQSEQESNRIARVNSAPTESVKPIKTEAESVKPVKTKEIKENTSEPEAKKVIKNLDKKTEEKKSIAS